MELSRSGCSLYAAPWLQLVATGRSGTPAQDGWVKKRLEVDGQIMQRGSPIAGRVGLCS